MAAFTLSPLKYGKVVGRFVAVVGDAADADIYPDAIPLGGTITFTPSAASFTVSDATPDPITAVTRTIVATLDTNGYLTFNGNQGVWLVATNDSTTNPSGFTYKVTYNLTYTDTSTNPNTTTTVSQATFNIQVPASDATNPSTFTDLANAAPVTASNGAVITVGPAGPVTNLQIGTVTTTTNLSGAAVTLTPVDAVTKALNFVVPVGTSGGSGGAGTVTAVAKQSPDATGNVTLTPANIGAATQSDLTTAQSTATNALTAANAAQTTGSNALSAANTAQTTASSALTTANSAQATANGVQSSLTGYVQTTALAAYAPLASAALTGTPTAPTAAGSTNNTQLATTAFVQALVAAVQSVTYNSAMVGWNKTTQSWGSRPAISGPVICISTNDATAPQPPWMAVGDSWIQNPNAAP